MVATASLNVLDYEFVEFAVRPVDSWDGSGKVVCQIQTQFGAGGDEQNGNQFLISLGLKFHTKDLPQNVTPNLPYELELQVRGRFETGSKVAPGAVPAPLVLNALMILYGAARGFIAAATAGFVNGAFIIPAVVFNDIVERASRDASTAVMPTPEMLKVGEPAAATFFRFSFAMEDLGEALQLISEEALRVHGLAAYQELLAALNAIIPGDHSTEQRAVSAQVDLANSVRDVAPPLGLILGKLNGRLQEGLEAVARRSLPVPPGEGSSE